jgi:Tetratricopeptide repeat
MRRFFLVAVLLVAGASAARGQGDALRNAKELFFDRKYSEARQAWQAVARQGGPDAVAASYWIARCSESLGEYDRALGEYGTYLAARPTDRTLAEEARTSRVGLAARLYKAGRTQHLPVLREALSDQSKTVRYFAALQLSTLGPEAGRDAVPVLQKIVQEETDPDLVDRAKVGLLRLDPRALSRTPGAGAAPPRGDTRWLKVRVFEKGDPKPKVVVNLPVALADMVFKSLPDDAKHELEMKGYDAENFWQQIKGVGPTQIIDIEGEDGEKIQIWIE